MNTAGIEQDFPDGFPRLGRLLHQSRRAFGLHSRAGDGESGGRLCLDGKGDRFQEPLFLQSPTQRCQALSGFSEKVVGLHQAQPAVLLMVLDLVRQNGQKPERSHARRIQRGATLAAMRLRNIGDLLLAAPAAIARQQHSRRRRLALLHGPSHFPLAIEVVFIERAPLGAFDSALLGPVGELTPGEVFHLGELFAAAPFLRGGQRLIAEGARGRRGSGRH